MGDTSIGWANKSWNPLRWKRRDNNALGYHCQKIAPECANCYAEAFNLQTFMDGGNLLPYLPTFEAAQLCYLDASRLVEPASWRKPQRVFPCSMTDWLGSFVPREYSLDLLTIAATYTRHRFLFLTKRWDAAGEWLTGIKAEDLRRRAGTLVDLLAAADIAFPSPNVWIGFTAGTRRSVEGIRVPLKRLKEAGIRTWLSAEPLLEPVDLTDVAPLLDWIVIGGESGRSARPCNFDWIRDAADQARAAGVPYFVKQVGSRPFGPPGDMPPRIGSAAKRWHLGARKGEDPAEWPSELRVQDYPVSML